MMHIRQDELGMFRHVEETMDDRIMDNPDEWDDKDHRAMDHIGRIGKTPTGAVVVTGEELNMIDARRLFKGVVEAELDNWVANASQRLITRAARALEVPFRYHVTLAADCGAEAHWHALVSDWVAEIFVMRCATCGHLYRA